MVNYDCVIPISVEAWEKLKKSLGMQKYLTKSIPKQVPSADKELSGKQLKSFLDWKKQVCKGCKWLWQELKVDMESTRIRLSILKTQLLDADGKIITGRRRIEGVIRCFKTVDFCAVITERITSLTDEQRQSVREFFSGHDVTINECLCRTPREQGPLTKASITYNEREASASLSKLDNSENRV